MSLSPDTIKKPSMPTAPHSPRSGKPYVTAIAAFLILIVIGVLALLPRLHHQTSLQQEANRDAGPPPVFVIKATTGTGSSKLELPGNVQAFEQTPIFARTSGYVKARYVDIGDHVRKGQLLAIIEDPQTEQQLRQAQAQVGQLRAQLLQSQANASLSATQNNRWKALVAQGVVAQQDADQKAAQAAADAANVTAARANIAAGEANVHNLEQQLSFSRVVAPFDGIILTRNIDAGSLISAGSASSVTQMFSIGQASTVRVFTSVAQSEAPALRPGQRATVSFRELPGSAYAGSITRTSASIDPATRTLLTEIDLKNDGRILPGMYATVTFAINRANPPVVIPPNALVIRTAGPQAVVVDANNIAHFRSLTLGRDVGTVTEVLSGLSPGDIVVLSPTDNVTDGAKVEPHLQQ